MCLIQILFLNFNIYCGYLLTLYEQSLVINSNELFNDKNILHYYVN